jgi:phosphoribosylglycinamide formyltransferase-1
MTAAVRRKKVVVLISGRGSNMESLIHAAREPDCPYEVVAVVSNRPAAPGLKKAAAAGVATAVVDHRQFDSREAFEEVLHETLLVFQADLVACAGFMRVLTATFTDRWQGRILNIHPSLLPLYRGLDTHARALADGVRLHGCTVHFVTADLDGGPIIAQGAVPVLPDDTPETLAARVLKVEHRLYPAALALVASGVVRMENGRAVGDWQADPEAWIAAPDVTCSLPLPSPGREGGGA